MHEEDWVVWMSDEDQEMVLPSTAVTITLEKSRKMKGWEYTQIFTQLFNALSHVCDDAQLTCENSHKIANEH